MKSILIIGIIILLSVNLKAQFINISGSSGVEHVNLTNSLMGGGAAFFDYNNDGFLDLYATSAIGGDKLYQNFGDGTFQDVSKQSNITSITSPYYTFGVIYGDINNDSFEDLFITTFQDFENNLLLLNQGDGTFVDISLTSGFSEPMSSTSAAFLDINNDGFLDLYVTNYIDFFKFEIDDNGIITGIDHKCLNDKMYLNNGDSTFAEITQAYGIDNNGCGLAVVSTDYDLDGDQDIYVINDHGMFVKPNTMYRNNFPSPDFTDVSESLQLNSEIYGMGVATGDYNADGYQDFYVTNLGNNVFHIRNNEGSYDEVAENRGVQNGFYEDSIRATGWASFFFDYDNDTDLDLYVTNGYISAGYFGIKTTLTDYNVLFENDGFGNFTDVSLNYSAIASPFIGRGAARGDFDNDGDEDFFIVNANDEFEDISMLIRNDFEGNNWVSIKLEGADTISTDAFGSMVKVFLGEKKFIKHVNSGGSHASQHSRILNFGLGAAVSIDSLIITWPNQISSKFYSVAINKNYQVNYEEPVLYILGCMDSTSISFNQEATLNSGCIIDKVIGCTDWNALNYDSLANFNDGSCEYPVTPPDVDDDDPNPNPDNLITSLDNSQEDNLKIYPNPAHNQLIVEALPTNINQLRFEIYTITGKQVLVNHEIYLGKIIFDISEITQGLYIMKGVLKSNNKVIITTRVVIK